MTRNAILNLDPDIGDVVSYTHNNNSYKGTIINKHSYAKETRYDIETATNAHNISETELIAIVKKLRWRWH